MRTHAAAIAACIVLVATLARADHTPLQVFPLDEALPETVVACRDEAAAVEITRALVIRDQRVASTLAQGYAERGVCGRMMTMVTYRKRVFSEHGRDGLWTVYAVDLHDDSRWFVIMLNWTHERDS